MLRLNKRNRPVGTTTFPKIHSRNGFILSLATPFWPFGPLFATGKVHRKAYLQEYYCLQPVDTYV